MMAMEAAKEDTHPKAQTEKGTTRILKLKRDGGGDWEYLEMKWRWSQGYDDESDCNDSRNGCQEKGTERRDEREEGRKKDISLGRRETERDGEKTEKGGRGTNYTGIFGK